MAVDSIPTKHRINPISLKNLKHEKGFTPNPGGRPKTAGIRQFLLDWLKVEKQGKTRQEKIVERMAKTKPEIIFYYAFGKPVETFEISGKDGAPIQVEQMSAQQILAERVRLGEMTPSGRLIAAN